MVRGLQEASTLSFSSKRMAGREKRQRINPKADAISHIKNKTDKLDSLEALFINAEKGYYYYYYYYYTSYY